MATIVSPPHFSPVEDAENIKAACQGSTFLWISVSKLMWFIKFLAISFTPLLYFYLAF
jgi:hypothetical protein